MSNEKRCFKVVVFSLNFFIPVVSLSAFSQSRMTKDGHPSTVTTVRLDGGLLGGEVTLFSPRWSSGKYVREEVMEQGSSGFLPVW